MAGPVAKSVAKKCGPVTRVPDSRDKRIADVERENLRWLRRAERAEALVELTGDSDPRPDEGAPRSQVGRGTSGLPLGDEYFRR